MGVDNDDVRLEASPEALCAPLPNGVTAAKHVIQPFDITDKLNDGTILDLGGRQLEVIHIPGHTDDSVALIDREAGDLWTGDSFYQGPIWLFADETDLQAYRRSIDKLAALVPELNALYPAHNTPMVDPAVLIDVKNAFAQVLNGEVQSMPEWDGVIRFQFDGFSFLLRENFSR